MVTEGFSAILLLKSETSVSAGALDAKIRNFAGTSVAHLKIWGGAEQAHVVEFNSIKLAVLYMPCPAPGFSTYKSDGPNLMWPDVERDVAQHRAHVVISSAETKISHSVSPVVLASAVTIVSAAIMALSVAPIGVYWEAGEQLVTAETFMRGAQGLCSGSGLPVVNWVRPYAFRTDSGILLCSRGLTPFLGRELEFVATKKDLGYLLSSLFAVSQHLIATGVTLRDGETIGREDNPDFRISLRDAGRMASGPVYRLDEPEPEQGANKT